MISFEPIQLLGLALVLISVGWLLADLVFPIASAVRSSGEAEQAPKGAGS